MGDNLRIRRETARDVNTIIGVIDEAADWLRGKDTDQWARPWPNRAARDGRVRRGLRNGNTWITEMDGQPVATLTQRTHGNQMLWTPEEDRTPAVYVSRLIVRRNPAGLSAGPGRPGAGPGGSNSPLRQEPSAAPWIADADADDDTTPAEIADAARIPVIADLRPPGAGPCQMVASPRSSSRPAVWQARRS